MYGYIDGTYHEVDYWGRFTGKTFRLNGFDDLESGESMTLKLTKTDNGVVSEKVG